MVYYIVYREQKAPKLSRDYSYLHLQLSRVPSENTKIRYDTRQYIFEMLSLIGHNLLYSSVYYLVQPIKE